jgi:hypothetical protein
VFQEFAPETVAAAFMLLSWRSWNPHGGCARVCPKSKWGRYCWSASGACKLLRAMSASEALKAEPRLLLRVQLGHNDDGCPLKNWGPMWSSELSPMESRTSGPEKLGFFRPDNCEGINNCLFIRKTTKRNTILYSLFWSATLMSKPRGNAV